MMGRERQICKINSISEFHLTRGLPKPDHPLISIVDYGAIDHLAEHNKSWVLNFYAISLKRDVLGKYRYGQMPYDFDQGCMTFLSPNQLLYAEIDQKQTEKKPSGWILFIHPDFLWDTTLAKKIQQYDFFDYAITEALFLSNKEERIIAHILTGIQQEYRSNIDHFSKNIIIAQIELLLNYTERFYERQFITREKSNHEILTRLAEVLKNYFDHKEAINNGLPTVQFIAQSLNISPTYLSTLLKKLTGQNAQQHIHEKLIEKAKEQLSTTNQTISEIAYELGFEHAQSFSKLFKAKTNFSPLEFRQSFN